MSRVHITGWRPGLAKISMTEAVRQFAGLGLAEAKRVTDDVLEGRPVVLICPSSAAATALATRLNERGAVAQVDPGDSRAGVA